jgi:hypothetical protein
MNDTIAQGSRAAAQRLSTPAHASLAEDVEFALATQDTAGGPDQYTDPAALGGLIVSVATLAWTVYNDIRSRGAAPTADTVTRRVRHQLDQTDTVAPELGPAERDRIIDVTVGETLNAAQDQENP